MKHRLRRPSPAMIVALIALVFAMAGSGYAAVQSLPKKSVGTKQLKANAVTGAKVKNQTLTGKDIKLKTLGTVPLANVANTANLANTVAPPVVHLVGAAGEPPFLAGSKNINTEGAPFGFAPAAFFKDASGIVHLEGGVDGGTEPELFRLPPGFRPAAGKLVTNPTSELLIFGGDIVFEGKEFSGLVLAPGGGAFLDGVSFRAQS